MKNVVKGLGLTPTSELVSNLNHYKFKLAMHLEERPTYAVNMGYVNYLERQIELCDDMLKDRHKLERQAA